MRPVTSLALQSHYRVAKPSASSVGYLPHSQVRMGQVNLIQPHMDLPPPLPIMELRNSIRSFQILKVAVELDVFSTMNGGKATAALVSQQRHLNPRATERLLNALTGLGFLIKEGSEYALTPLSQTYLVKDSPLFMSDYLTKDIGFDSVWDNLKEHIQTGKTFSELSHLSTYQANLFYPAMARSIFPLSYTTAKMTAEKLGIDQLPPGSRVLDVAAGSGAWSIPLAQLNPGLRVDALDYPAVIYQTYDFVRKFNLLNQYGYLRGTWQDYSFGPQTYDVITLGHLIHYESPATLSNALFPKLYNALKPGGRLIIGEFIPNEQKTKPAYHTVFDLSMSLTTPNGQVYTKNELETLLKHVGFSRVYRLPLPYYGAYSPVVVAEK